MYGIEWRQSALLFVDKDNVFNEYPPNPVGIFGRLLRKSQFLSVCLRYGLQPGGKLMVECYKVFAVRIGEGETCVVETLDRAGNEKILTDGFNREVVFEPGLRMVQVELEKAKTGEKRSDWQRLLDTLAETDGEVEPGQMEVDLKLAGELK